MGTPTARCERVILEILMAHRNRLCARTLTNYGDSLASLAPKGDLENVSQIEKVVSELRGSGQDVRPQQRQGDRSSLRVPPRLAARQNPGDLETTTEPEDDRIQKEKGWKSHRRHIK